MATTPSNFTRLQPSIFPALAGPGLRVTLGTPVRPAISRQPTPRVAALFAMAKEPEDARLTGGTRTLDRRLLALNLSGVTKKVLPSPVRVSATLHSTAA
jgi:hypothetical protein